MGSKRVAAATCYFQHNYGSMLQAYATQRAVEQLGYEVMNLSTAGIARDIRNRKLRYYGRQLTNWHIVQEKWGAVKRALRQKTDPALRAHIAKRDACFRAFQQQTFHVTEPLTWAQMHDYAASCQAVLVGSDQLWLPSNIAADFYTLTWAPEAVNKVAYATSFGIGSLPPRYLRAAHDFLGRIQHVSVREQAGQAIVRAATGREVPVVCDPTLLFAAPQWAELVPERDIVGHPYIFCYFLGDNPNQRVFARTVRERLGLPIVATLHLDNYIPGDEGFPDETRYDIGPAEFVNLIRHASLVLTDSFHGTVFSVLHGRPFLTFRRFRAAGGLSTNSRMDSLFSLLGLPERLAVPGEAALAQLSQTIDYEPVWQRLAALRQASWQYLEEALADE